LVNAFNPAAGPIAPQSDIQDSSQNHRHLDVWSTDP